MNRHHRIHYGRISIPALVVAAALPAGAAFAQSAPGAAQPASTEAPPPAKPAIEVKEVIVTGSHVVRNSYNAPTPVNTVGAEQMTNLGITDVGDALNQLPSFRATTTPSENLFQVRNDIGANTMDLRGLGPTRTLTLVNGRRFAPASDNGTVDLNAIPSIMVDRSEVVTGGASAAYGADAVAGVVNVILDTRYQGLKLDVSQGMSQRNDNKTAAVGMLAGTSFADSRGHTILGFEFASDSGIGDIERRDWGRRHENYVANPNWTSTGTQPATIVSPNAIWAITPGGVIPSGPLKGTQFNAQGQPEAFQFGNPVGGTLMIGGDPAIKGAYIIDNVPLITATEHTSVFSHTEYDLTSKIKGTFEASFADVQGGPAWGADPYDFSHTIQIDNAFLPAATKQAMIAAGVTSIPVSRLSSEFGAQNGGVSDNKTYRILLGAKGDLFADWKWDLSYSWGRTDGRVDISNNRISANWNNAIDAVYNSSGQIVCRSSLTNPNNGCIPFSFFGAPTSKPAAASYVMANAWQTRTFELQDVALDFNGPLYHTWAGPIMAAAGVEYRAESYRGDADPISKAAGFTQNYAVALPPGELDVTEGYGEINVPLLKDAPLAKSFEVDAASRYTNYSNTGSATTWKLGAVYKVNDEVMFRVTDSRDIRAPSPAELSPVASTTSLPLLDPATKATYFMNIVTSGNPHLQLEKALTFTAGTVVQPKFIPHLSISADYYNIKIGNAIDILAPQATINLCAAGNTGLCQFVTRDGSGQITTVTSAYQNLSSLKTSGWEWKTDYGVDLHALWAKVPGKLNLGLNANYINNLEEISATGQVQQFVNWTGNPGSVQNLLGVPRWRLNLLSTYRQDNWSLTAEYRYVPQGLLDPTKIGPGQQGYSPTLANSASYNFVSSRWYLDLSARVQIGTVYGAKTELYGVVNNVMDMDPPPQLRLFGNPLYFDPIGRNFKLGLRAKW